MFDGFAATEPIEDRLFFLTPLARDDEGDRLPDRFLRAVVEEAFGAAVPLGDDSMKGALINLFWIKCERIA